jgi:transposase-like protein
MTQGHSNAKRGKIIQIDEEQVKDHLGEIVGGTVQETLNALLDDEADRLCRAKRYERTDERQNTRAGDLWTATRKRFSSLQRSFLCAKIQRVLWTVTCV